MGSNMIKQNLKSKPLCSESEKIIWEKKWGPGFAQWLVDELQRNPSFEEAHNAGI